MANITEHIDRKASASEQCEPYMLFIFFDFFQCTDTFKQMCKEAWQKLSARKNLQKEKMFDAAKPHGNIFPI